MSNAALLQRLGFFIQEDFLSPALCAHLLAGIRSTEGTPAMVLSKAGELSQVLVPAKIDALQRVTQQVTPPASADCLIRERLTALQPTLEQHFDLAFQGYQAPLWYRYQPGGFFAAHQDCTDTADAPKFLRDRRVSVVIFLNSQGQAPQPDHYCGGALTFYGLMNDPRYGFPLNGTAGMLVAFRSDISHEVKQITEGERYSVVSWFY